MTAVINNIPNRRIFFVDTPLGKLKIYAKYDLFPTRFDDNDIPVFECRDSAEDYPGVFIDLIRPGMPDDSQGEMLCCLEYDSGNDRLLNCVYEPGADEPVYVHAYERE